MNPKLKKLREYRRSMKFSTKEMAHKLNISQSMYSYIELGQKRLSYTLAVKLANIFKVTPDELFYEDFKQFFDTPII